jgi:hypothetical protein
VEVIALLFTYLNVLFNVGLVLITGQHYVSIKQYGDYWERKSLFIKVYNKYYFQG